MSIEPNTTTLRRVRRAAARVLLLAAMILVLPACTTKTSDKDLKFVDPVEGMSLVQGKKKLLGLAGTAKGVWVDPRTAVEYRREHIPGAMLLPWDVDVEHRKLRDFDVIVVYGEEYNSPVALAMSKLLIENGYSNVRTLRGGLRAWKAAGYETATGDEPGN